MELEFDGNRLASVLQILHIFMQFFGDLGKHLHDLSVIRLVSKCPFYADAFALLSATGGYCILRDAQMCFAV